LDQLLRIFQAIVRKCLIEVRRAIHGGGNQSEPETPHEIGDDEGDDAESEDLETVQEEVLKENAVLLCAVIV